MEYRQFYTIGQAAQVTGKAKSTIKKAIDNSELSVSDKTGRGFKIEASELDRVFPFLNGERSRGRSEKQRETIIKNSENSALSAEVEMLRQQLASMGDERERERAQLSDQIEDLRTRLTKADEERTRLTAILTDQRQKAAEPPRKGLWSRLAG